jgi:cytochrome c-type biogenesis protein CcmH/NrfG
VGLLSILLAPITGVVKIGEVLERQVDNELHGRAAARRQLEELEEERAAGRISEHVERQREREIVQRMIG